MQLSLVDAALDCGAPGSSAGHGRLSPDGMSRGSERVPICPRPGARGLGPQRLRGRAASPVRGGNTGRQSFTLRTFRLLFLVLKTDSVAHHKGRSCKCASRRFVVHSELCDRHHHVGTRHLRHLGNLCPLAVTAPPPPQPLAGTDPLCVRGSAHSRRCRGGDGSAWPPVTGPRPAPPQGPPAAAATLVTRPRPSLGPSDVPPCGELALCPSANGRRTSGL